MIHPVIALEEKRGLLHSAILARLQTLITEASSGTPTCGFGRVLETLEQIAEHHLDANVKAIAPLLTEALTKLFTDQPFSMIDVHDHRTEAQLDATYDIPLTAKDNDGE